MENKIRYFVQCVYTDPDTGKSWPVGAVGRVHNVMSPDAWSNPDPSVRQFAYDFAFRTYESAKEVADGFHKRCEEWSGNLIEMDPPKLPSGAWFIERHHSDGYPDYWGKTELYIGRTGTEFPIGSSFNRTAGFRTRNSAVRFSENYPSCFFTDAPHVYAAVFIPDGATEPLKYLSPAHKNSDVA